MTGPKYVYSLVFLTTFRFSAVLSSGIGFKHSAILDSHGKYRVKWKHHETTITFEMEVETTGYVGFGFSPNGEMALSDIVIGGVENGKPYLQVRFGWSSSFEPFSNTRHA